MTSPLITPIRVPSLPEAASLPGKAAAISSASSGAPLSSNDILNPFSSRVTVINILAEKFFLSIDRLDYSKGILLKLKAFHDLLERFPELLGKVTLVQLTVPSRENIPAYQKLKEQIEGLVSEINGRFAQPGWTPVQYVFRCVTRPELLAYYRAADVALITSLKDGMNLVAKEYCAANIDNDGVLVLSEFTGAAAQLGKYALLVNPYDIDGLVVTLHNALNMTVVERKLRMNKMRNSIRKRDIYWWADSFLKSAKHNQA